MRERYLKKVGSGRRRFAHDESDGSHGVGEAAEGLGRGEITQGGGGLKGLGKGESVPPHFTV